MFELYQRGKREGAIGPYKGTVSYPARPFFAAQLSHPSRVVLKAMMQGQFFEPDPGPEVFRYRADTYHALLGARRNDELALRRIRRALAGTRPVGLRITHHQAAALHRSIEEVQAMKEIVMDRVFTFLRLDDIFVETTLRAQRGYYEFLDVKLFAVQLQSKGGTYA